MLLLMTIITMMMMLMTMMAFRGKDDDAKVKNKSFVKGVLKHMRYLWYVCYKNYHYFIPLPLLPTTLVAPPSFASTTMASMALLDRHINESFGIFNKRPPRTTPF